MTAGVISQPNYLPWIGYFQLITAGDIYVYLDDVQFTYRDWRNRNRISVDDKAVWLTIPVVKESASRKQIKDVMIDNSTNWGRHHLELIARGYRNCAYFDEIQDLIIPFLTKKSRWLVDVTIGMTDEILKYLDCNLRIYRSSEIGASGISSERLVQICKILNVDKYISGPAAVAYLKNCMFSDAGISLQYYEYRDTLYPRDDKPKIGNLSIIDVLMYHGRQAAYLMKKNIYA